MDIIKAVKKLGNKLTGETYTSKDLVDLIDDIAEDYNGSSGGGGLVVHVDGDTGALDKKYSEIVAAAQVGYVGMLTQNGQDEYDVYSLVGYGYDSGDGYCVFFKGSTSSVATFAAETEDGYPVAAD